MENNATHYAVKKPRLGRQETAAGNSAGLGGLFDAIGPPGSDRQPAARSAQTTDLAGSHLHEGLLALGASTDRIRKMMAIFEPAFSVRQVGVIAALAHKDQDRAPRAAALSDSEYLALRYYLGPDHYTSINQYLRQPQVSPSLERVVTLIKEALTRLESPATRISFRAVKRRYAPLPGVYTEPAFLSASEVMGRADAFMKAVYGVDDGPDKSMIVIFGLAARQVRSGIDEGGNGLKEVIYPPGTRFNVIFRGISTRKNGTHMLVMEQAATNNAGTVKRQVEALALASLGFQSI